MGTSIIDSTQTPIYTIFYRNNSRIEVKFKFNNLEVTGEVTFTISPADHYARAYMEALYAAANFDIPVKILDIDHIYIAVRRGDAYRLTRPISLLDLAWARYRIILADEPVGEWSRTISKICERLDRKGTVLSQLCSGKLGLSYIDDTVCYINREVEIKLLDRDIQVRRAVTGEEATVSGITLLYNTFIIDDLPIVTERFPELAGRYNIHLAGIGSAPIHVVDGRVIIEEVEEMGGSLLELF